MLTWPNMAFWTFHAWSMSITVEVSLLSGKTATVEAGLDEAVETLTQRAQIALLLCSRSGPMCEDHEFQDSER